MRTARRTERFGLALSQSERDGLRYLAEVEGLAEADVLRRMLRTAINELPVETKRAIEWPMNVELANYRMQN
ncbi:MAG: hypothetical protein ABTQ73_05675 [Caldilineales bacterium]